MAFSRIEAEETDEGLFSSCLRVLSRYMTGEIPPGEAAITLRLLNDVFLDTDDPWIRARSAIALSICLRGNRQFDEAIAEATRARSLIALQGDVEDALQLTAEVELEVGVATLLRGDVTSAESHLMMAHDCGLERLAAPMRLLLLGSLALTSYIAREARTSETWLDEHDACVLDPTVGYGCEAAVITRLLICVERDAREEGRRLRDVVTGAGISREWQPIATAAGGYFLARESRFSEGLDAFDRALQDVRGKAFAGYWLNWFHLIRTFFFMRLGRTSDGWRSLRLVEPDDRHLACPAREVAAMRLRLGDVGGAVAALEPCEVLGMLHAPRSRAGVDWVRAAIELERGALAVSDAHADAALISMARNDALGPLYFVPKEDGESLLSRARARPHLGVEVYLARATAYYAAKPNTKATSLTQREREVLTLLAHGKSVDVMAGELFLSRNTIKTHVRRIYAKLDISNRASAIEVAILLGLMNTRGAASGAGRSDTPGPPRGDEGPRH